MNTSSENLRGKISVHGITRVRVNTVDLKGEVCKVDWIIVAQERFLMKLINDPSIFTDSREF